jgi:hypothetical protein
MQTIHQLNTITASKEEKAFARLKGQRKTRKMNAKLEIGNKIEKKRKGKATAIETTTTKRNQKGKQTPLFQAWKHPGAPPPRAQLNQHW